MKKIFSNLWIIFAMVLLSFMRNNPICKHESGRSDIPFLPKIEEHNNQIVRHHVDSINIDAGFFSDTINWKLLNQLEYKEENHDAYGVVMMPVFAKNVMKYHNKKVIIKGYILPVDRKSYALSKNVYAACFFCGKAGPETIIGLHFEKHPGRIKMDTYATVTGTLKINGTDVEDWMYSLTDVEILYMKE